MYDRYSSEREVRVNSKGSSYRGFECSGAYGVEVEHLFVASLVIKIIKSNCQLLVFGGTYLIKKCDKGYYKVRQLLVANCDNFITNIKVRQVYYKVRR